MALCSLSTGKIRTLAIAQGLNAITVTATDPAGNENATTINLRRGEGKLTVSLLGSMYKFNAKKLPKRVTFTATVTGPDGRRLNGATALFAVNAACCTFERLVQIFRGTVTIRRLLPHVMHLAFLGVVLSHLVSAVYGDRIPGVAIPQGGFAIVGGTGWAMRLDRFDAVMAPDRRFLPQGVAWTREQLGARVHGEEFDAFDRSIDSHVKNLRAKLGARPDGGAYVETVRGIGYRASRLASSAGGGSGR